MKSHGRVLQSVTIDPINCRNSRCLGDWEDETRDIRWKLIRQSPTREALERKIDSQRDPVSPCYSES